MNEAQKLTRSSAIAEGPCDALVSIEILQLRNIPFEEPVITHHNHMENQCTKLKADVEIFYGD